MKRYLEEKKEISLLTLLLIVFPFFKPDIVVSFPNINILFCVYLLVSIVVIAINYAKKNRLSFFLIMYFIYVIIAIFSTFINDGNILKAFFDFLQNIGIIMLVELYSKNDTKKLFKVFLILFYFYTIANTISFIIYPQGIIQTEITKAPIYLLGIDNRFAFTYLPGVCIVAIYELLSKQKLTKITYFYLLLTYFTFIYFWSAGALVAESLMILFFFLLYKKIHIKPTNYFYFSIIGFISLVFLRIQNLFKFLIVDILHKDLTLSSRTLLWDKSIDIIKDNLFIGIGVQKNNVMINNISAYHSHCYYLNILLQSGIFGLLSFLTVIYISLRELSKCKNDMISKIVSFTIFALLVMLLADTFDITCNFVLLLSVGYCISNISRKDDVHA